MQHTQEKDFTNTLYLTEEEQVLSELDLNSYSLVNAEEVEQLTVLPQLKWAYSVAFDDSMQFELRFKTINDTKACLIADWYREGVFYQEEVLTTNPIGQVFNLMLPIDLTTTLTYETIIQVISPKVKTNE